MSFINYTYIIVDQLTRKAAIVDPAWELDKIEDKLREVNAQVDCILLTHSHSDHTNLVDPLVKRYNVDVYMSKKEIEFYQFQCSNLISVEDQDVINLGKTDITCLHTPGHTAGGMCYSTVKSLFTGDTVFIEGCGMCIGSGANVIEMFESLQKIKKSISDNILIYPGHSYGKDPGKRFSYLLSMNIYFNIDDVDRFVAIRMRKNQRAMLNFK